MSEHERVTVVILDRECPGIGPSGSGILVPAGAYVRADLDGMEEDILMLQNPGADTLMAKIHVTDVSWSREVRKSPYATQWARYFRDHPEVLASWGEQNYRPCPGYDTEG